MSKIWFTSDTHFGSKRTLELSKRPFESVEEMDKVLIENWNNVVGECDIVIHLGDFGNYERVKELNGFVKLIKGNYEKSDSNFDEFKDCFDSVLSDNPNYWIDHTIDDFTYNYKITMRHKPSSVKDTKITKNHINIFGHTHKLCMVKPYGLNVGVDCHNFKPIDIDTILFYHNGILNFYDNEVFN